MVRYLFDDWFWPLLAAIVLVLSLMFLSSGCMEPGAGTGAVSPGAVSPGAVAPGAVAPGAVGPGAVEVQPGAVTGEATGLEIQPGGQASFTVDSVWKLLPDLEARLTSLENIVSGIQTRLESQMSQSVVVTQNKGSTLTYALAGAAVGAIGLLLLYLRSQKRLPASLARRMTALLSTVVEKRPEDQALRDLIVDLAPDFGVSRADIRQARKVVGTLPLSAGGA
jgi:hypothetical protein